VANDVVDIADAVVVRLNANQLGQSFTAVRRFVPVYKLDEMNVLRVTVVPATSTIEIAARSAIDNELVEIDIGIQKRVEMATNEQADDLMEFVRGVVDLFRRWQVPDGTKATVVSISNEPIFDPQHMDQLNQFTSVIRLGFRFLRAN
jgi:hypothetical protein